MKSINPTFEDSEFTRLVEIKVKLQSVSWREFILKLADKYEDKNDKQ